MRTQPTVATGRIKLKRFDPAYCGGLDKDTTRILTEANGRRIDELQQLLYANSRHALLLIFQGMDASGKDGSVRSVLRHVNPAGVQVANFKVPSDEERAHDYLWRVHQAVPRCGTIGDFNRSHYEAARFQERLANPKKYWKFSHADLTTRQHWDDYIDAYEDMLSVTSHPEARWHVVPADRNWYRDYVVSQAVVQALEDLHLKWPKAKAGQSRIRIK